MTRRAEAVLLGSSAALAGFGVALVELSRGQRVGAEVGLTFFVFLFAFGGLHLAIRTWADRAVTALLPLAAILTATGFVEIYRLDPDLASRQRWWLLISAVFASGMLYGLAKTGTDTIRRYRYLILATSVILLLLPLLPTSGGFPLRGRLVMAAAYGCYSTSASSQFSFNLERSSSS